MLKFVFHFRNEHVRIRTIGFITSKACGGEARTEPSCFLTNDCNLVTLRSKIIVKKKVDGHSTVIQGIRFVESQLPWQTVFYSAYFHKFFSF